MPLSEVRTIRSDWRFIIPNVPIHRCVALRDDELASTAGRFYLVDMLEKGTPGNYDLALAVAPRVSELTDLRSALRPGALCYVEWPAHFLSTPRLISRQLSKAGLEVLQTWIRHSDGVSAGGREPVTTWCPFNNVAPLRFLLETRRANHQRSRRSQIYDDCLAALVGLAPRALVECPSLWDPMTPFSVCTVAVRPGTRGIDRVPRALSLMRSQWDDLHLGAGPRELPIALRTGGSGTSQIIVFIFASDSDRLPGIVSKIADTEPAMSEAEAEAEVLRAVSRRAADLPGIPSALLSIRHTDCVCQAQTYVAGAPVEAGLARTPIEDVAESVTDWSLELARRTVTRRDQSYWHARIEHMLQTVATSPGVDSTSDVRFQLTREALSGMEVPVSVRLHGDFGPWNIHRDVNGALGVVDWSGSMDDGPPGADLAYFLTMVTMAKDDAFQAPRWQVSYRSMWAEASDSVARRCLRRYLIGLGLPEPTDGLLYQFRLLAWLALADCELPAERAISSVWRFWSEELSMTASGRPGLHHV